MIGLKVIFIIDNSLLKYPMNHIKCAVLILEYHKAQFLGLYFSYYTLMTLVMLYPAKKVKLFAGDTNMLVSCSSISSVNNKVNTCMKLLNDWFVANNSA